ncbi:MAG: hypothetical protein GY696_27600, partial [Gammaproteobacteria bacterium]|nr:hypothetical protein [Gammaproteobacteria bacterium]
MMIQISLGTFFSEKRSYAAAVIVFISVLKYANKWMRVFKTHKQQGVEVAAESEEPELPKYVVAAHTFLAANLQVVQKEKFRDEKY